MSSSSSLPRVVMSSCPPRLPFLVSSCRHVLLVCPSSYRHVVVSSSSPIPRVVMSSYPPRLLFLVSSCRHVLLVSPSSFRHFVMSSCPPRLPLLLSSCRHVLLVSPSSCRHVVVSSSHLTSPRDVKSAGSRLALYVVIAVLLLLLVSSCRHVVFRLAPRALRGHRGAPPPRRRLSLRHVHRLPAADDAPGRRARARRTPHLPRRSPVRRRRERNGRQFGEATRRQGRCVVKLTAHPQLG